MALLAGDLDDDTERVEQEVDASDVAIARAEHHLGARARQTRFADEFEESALEHGVASGIGQHLLHPQAAPSARPAKVCEPAQDHFGRGEVQTNCAVDRRLDPPGVSAGKGEIEHCAGCRHRPQAVDDHLVDRSQPSGGVHHERHDRGPSAPIDGELHRSGIGPIESVECCRRFEAHPTPLSEAEQPGAEATSMRVGRSSQGVHARGDPMDHSVGDQSVLLPGRDADDTELCRGHHTVLVGGEVGEGRVELHAHPWVPDRRRRKTPVCVTLLLARPNRTATQTGGG